LDTLIAPPPELVAKTLLVKKIAGFPPTLEGIDAFKEPKRMGKTEFRARLAIDLISYGIHTQRTRGKLLPVDPFVETFLRERPRWDTTPETIRKMLRTLADEGVVTTTAAGEVVFEPIDLSREICQVLLLADAKGVLALEDLCDQHNWAPEKARYVLAHLEKEGIAIWDMTERLYYFPTLASRRTG